MRAKAKSKFKQTLFKLLINANYGKTIEDIRKRSNVEIVRDETRAKRLVARPQYKGYQILNEDFTLVHSMKGRIKLIKPIACGFIVLEESKHIMMRYWYDVLKRRYQDNIKLILSDTDSLLFVVYTDDFYKDMLDPEFKHHLDLSNYDGSSIMYDGGNKKVIGKFKDERANQYIAEVIALKPKMYSILSKKIKCDNSEEHTCEEKCLIGHSTIAKGVPGAAQKSLSHEDYRNVLEKASTKRITASSIRSYKHQLYTIKINKTGLSAFDDKKYVMDDGVETLSYGHYKIGK